jgi:hypothetical protein
MIVVIFSRDVMYQVLLIFIIFDRHFAIEGQILIVVCYCKKRKVMIVIERGTIVLLYVILKGSRVNYSYCRMRE